jgi:general stress protein YciG
MGAPANATTNWAATETNRLPATAQATSNTPKAKGKRGFASMDPVVQRRIASMGGRAAHQSGHAHEWNSETAAEAGRKRHSKSRAAKLGSGL